MFFRQALASVVTSAFRRLALIIGGLIVMTTFAAAQDIAEPRQISGVYPDLTTYGVYSQDGAHLKSGHDECGIGAVVPWAGKL
ncbi:MAG: hypothetical protein KDA81_14315, partial [Planctomycetaceae bacterium]|nr:hypothetical protein [Planctomycetaceae bacterium]